MLQSRRSCAHTYDFNLPSPELKIRIFPAQPAAGVTHELYTVHIDSSISLNFPYIQYAIANLLYHRQSTLSILFTNHFNNHTICQTDRTVHIKALYIVQVAHTDSVFKLFIWAAFYLRLPSLFLSFLQIFCQSRSQSVDLESSVHVLGFEMYDDNS